MKSLSRIGAAIALAAIAATVQAQVLTFEGVGNNQQVANFYNGGAGGSLGISFGTGSLGLVDADAGGTGNFSNNPSGVTVLYFTDGNSAIMNVAAGFDTGFSFYYGAFDAGSVVVYDGLNGSGSILSTITLPVTTGAPDVWVPVGVSFAGTAFSVGFGGTANKVAFDNITLRDATPSQAGGVPEPSALIVSGIFAAGIGGMIVKRRISTA